MAEITKVGPDAAGCWVDGHWGQYGISRAIALAEGYGYPDKDVIAIAHKHLASNGTFEEVTPDDYDTLVQVSDEVDEWMTNNVAPEGFYFGWHEGEWFLSDENEEDY